MGWWKEDQRLAGSPIKVLLSSKTSPCYPLCPISITRQMLAVTSSRFQPPSLPHTYSQSVLTPFPVITYLCKVDRSSFTVKLYTLGILPSGLPLEIALFLHSCIPVGSTAINSRLCLGLKGLLGRSTSYNWNIMLGLPDIDR